MTAAVDVGRGAGTSAPVTSARSSREPWALGLGTAALLLVGIGTPAWSGDEAATVVVVRRSGDQLWAVLGNDPAIAPYYLLMDVWSRVSMSSVWLRLPSALAMALAVALLFPLVAGVLGRRAAWTACSLLAVLPAVVRYGQEARPYALATAAVVAGAALWWRAVGARSWRWTWAAVAAFVMAGLLHAYSLLVAFSLVLAMLIAPVHDRRSDVVRTAWMAGGAALVLSPYLGLLALRAQGHPDPAPATPAGVAQEVLRLPVALLGLPGAALLAAVVLGVAGAGFALGSSRLRGTRRSFVVAAAVWCTGPPAALVLLQLVTGRPGVVGRYWTVCLPALAIGAGYALALLPRRWPVAAVVGLAALALPSQLALRTIDGHQGQRWAVLPVALAVPGIDDVGLLIRGYPERGLAANDPVAADVRTPLGGDAAAQGLLSPVQAPPGSPRFAALVRDADEVLVYERLPSPDAPLRAPDALHQPDELLAVFSRGVITCRWFQDQLVLLARPADVRDPAADAALARRVEAVAPDRVRCSVL